METPRDDREEPDRLDAIYGAGDAAYRAAGEVPPRWNTMKDMRKALGLPLGNDGIEEFLAFWDSLNQAQRTQFRREDLANIDDWDFKAPAHKENN